MTRRGTTIIAITGRSLPRKANEPAHPRQRMPARSINYTRMVPAMRECTHSRASVPNDTPDGGWL